MFDTSGMLVSSIPPLKRLGASTRWRGSKVRRERDDLVSPSARAPRRSGPSSPNSPPPRTFAHELDRRGRDASTAACRPAGRAAARRLVARGVPRSSAERADLASARDRLAALGAARPRRCRDRDAGARGTAPAGRAGGAPADGGDPVGRDAGSVPCAERAACALKGSPARASCRALAHPVESAAERCPASPGARRARPGARAPPFAAAAWGPEMRRFGLALGLAAADLAAPGTEIALGGDETDDRRLTAGGDGPGRGRQPRRSGPGLGLLTAGRAPAPGSRSRRPATGSRCGSRWRPVKPPPPRTGRLRALIRA